jgi:HEAT repeat protein
MLEDEKWSVREETAAVIAKMGPAAAGATERLFDRLRVERNEHAHFAFIGALMALRPPASRILEALRSGEPVWRGTALYLIGEAEPADRKVFVPDLIAFLREKPATDTTRIIIFLLGECGSEAEEALPEIRAYLNDKDRNLRQAAREACTKISATGLKHDEILACLESWDHDKVDAACKHIERLGPAGDIYVPILLEKMAHGRMMDYIEKALKGVGAAAVPHLVRVLEDEDPNQYAFACQAIMVIGPSAEGAIDALERAMRKKPWPGFSVRALGAIGKAAVPALIRALESLPKENQFEIIQRFEIIGKDAREALPALKPFLEHENEMLRKAARRAVDSIEGVERVWEPDKEERK